MGQKIDDNSYEAKLIFAKLLITHLQNIGQIKGEPLSEDQIEKEFKKHWDKRSSQKS